MRPGPRVAIVSVGIGRVQRGFERCFTDLFNTLSGDLDMTLFKSGGKRTSREKVPRLLKPATSAVRALGRLAGRQEYHRDCVAFGLVLLPYLLHERFDVVHCIDPPLAIVLHHLKRLFRLRCRVLYTEGSATPLEHYPPVDHIHHVGSVAYRNALAYGIPASRMTLIPLGIDTERFSGRAGREEVRKAYGIPDSTFVILAISAVKRAHKRIDHLIEEVCQLQGDVLLWIDGNPEDPSIPELARRKLARRCRITHVPSDEVPRLYRLADLLVSASLTEAFGLAVVEAMSSGIGVLAHDSPHFQWLVGDRNCLVDMSRPGVLAARLRELMQRPDMLRRRACDLGAKVRRRFDWRSLRPVYLDMYHKVAASDS